MNTQQLWQAQALDAPRISLALVRHHSDALQRRTRIVNVINYVGGVAGMAFMAWRGAEFFSVNPLASAAISLWIAAGLVGLFLQRKRMSAEERPAELGVLDAIRFHRRQLERQRDARRGGGRWVPLLFVPGHVVYFVSLFAEITPIPWKAIIFNAAVIGIGTWVAIAMTDRRARMLQQEIDALDSL
jgi:hypothetical protein